MVSLWEEARILSCGWVLMVPSARLEANSGLARGSPSNLLSFRLSTFLTIKKTSHKKFDCFFSDKIITYIVFVKKNKSISNNRKRKKAIKMMHDYQKRLVDRLLELNQSISVTQAQTWIELLWEDFESTYAKAGREYQGMEVTEKVVNQWIENYGEKLHEFVAQNPKYKDFFMEDKKKMN